MAIRCQAALPALFLAGLVSSPAAAQGVYTTLDFGNNSTFLTGIRGPNIVGNYVIPGTSSTGGLLYVNGRMPVVRVCMFSDGARLLIEVWDQAMGFPVLHGGAMRR